MFCCICVLLSLRHLMLYQYSCKSRVAKETIACADTTLSDTLCPNGTCIQYCLVVRTVQSYRFPFISKCSDARCSRQGLAAYLYTFTRLIIGSNIGLTTGSINGQNMIVYYRIIIIFNKL